MAPMPVSRNTGDTESWMAFSSVSAGAALMADQGNSAWIPSCEFAAAFCPQTSAFQACSGSPLDVGQLLLSRELGVEVFASIQSFHQLHFQLCGFHEIQLFQPEHGELRTVTFSLAWIRSGSTPSLRRVYRSAPHLGPRAHHGSGRLPHSSSSRFGGLTRLRWLHQWRRRRGWRPPGLPSAIPAPPPVGVGAASDPSRAFNSCFRQCGVLASFQPVGKGSEGLGQIEQNSQSPRAVEVIVHRADEALLELHQTGVGWSVIGGHCTLRQGRGCAPAEALTLAIPQAESSIEPLPAGGRGVQGFGGEIKGFAVVRLEHKQAQGHRRDSALQQRADGGEVAERFAHLLPAHIDHAVVHPDPGQVLACSRFGLGDLVLMVREHQIGSSEMDVDRVAEFRTHHG